MKSPSECEPLQPVIQSLEVEFLARSIPPVPNRVQLQQCSCQIAQVDQINSSNSFHKSTILQNGTSVEANMIREEASNPKSSGGEYSGGHPCQISIAHRQVIRTSPLAPTHCRLGGAPLRWNWPRPITRMDGAHILELREIILLSILCDRIERSEQNIQHSPNPAREEHTLLPLEY